MASLQTLRTSAAKIKYYDILAAVFAVAAFSFLFVRVAYGINRIDESFYLGVVQRFVGGDRPFVDELHLSQLSDMILIPFYLLFRAVTGGIEGVILFMRRLFIVVDFAFFWIVYLKLRSYRIWGLLAAAVISAYIPWGMFTLNYYTMTPRLLTLVCLILLFGKQDLSRPRLLLAGFLLAAAVMVEPPLILLYLLFSLIVLIRCLRKKRRGIDSDLDFILNRRCWSYITLAAAFCAAILVVFLCLKSGISNIFRSLPELLSDSEYDFSLSGNVRYFLVSKIANTAEVLGSYNLWLSVLLCGFILLYAKRIQRGDVKKKEIAKEKYFLLLLSELLLLSFCIYPLVITFTKEESGINDWFYYVVTPVPLYAFGLINYVLCEKKDKRLLAVWCVALVSSAIMDSFSDVSFSVCGSLTAIPAFLCFGSILKESGISEKPSDTKPRRKNEKTGKNAGRKKGGSLSRVFIIASVAVISLVCVWECANIYFEGTFLYDFVDSEASELERIDSGTYKGIRTASENVQAYRAMQADVKTIRSMTQGPIYMDCLHPIALLELDCPTSNCSVWNSEATRDRQQRFFIAHPEKTPDLIYCFKNATSVGEDEIEQQTALFKEYADLLCEGTAIQGEAGIIVKVDKWKDPADPATMSWILEHQKEF